MRTPAVSFATDREEGQTAFRTGIGFLGGFAVGYILWNLQIHRSRRDLFSKSPVRRLAALGYLGGHPGVETARLLTDYVRWETRPALRRRGMKLLRRMNEYLD